jgi:hypothetical protein
MELNLKKFEEANQSLSMAIYINPKEYVYHANKAICLKKLRKYYEAINEI